MKYNFNEKIDRSNNHAAKWEEMGNKFISNDLWPMWIADMDLKTAPVIIDAMREKLEQGIFGYVTDQLHIIKVQLTGLKEDLIIKSTLKL